MAKDSKKPILKLHSLRILCEIDAYIREYDCRGDALTEASSDVLDGAVFRREIDDLIQRKLLTVVRHWRRREGDWYEDGPGFDYTVDLTNRAIAAFWPERAHELRNRKRKVGHGKR